MRAIRILASAALAGSVLLGVSLVLLDDSPLARVGLLAGGVALLGGVVSRTVSLPIAGRVVIAVGVVVLARLSAGIEGAVAVAVLVTLGWLLRLSVRDWLLALAAYGLALAAVSGVSLRVVLAFGLLGGVAVGLSTGVRAVAARRSASGGALGSGREPERPAAVPEEVVP